MRVLVTGAAGFIGSHLVERLVGLGAQVLGLDNFDPFYDRALKERNLAALGGDSSFELVEGEVLDPRLLETLLWHRVDRVVHLAALAGVQPSLGAPERFLRVNVEGTARVLEACRRRGVQSVIVASSSSVYGARQRVPFREKDPCHRPASPYAASKTGAEAICAAYAQAHGLAVTCLRYFTVYGPRQRPDMGIHRFVRLALADLPLPLYGDEGGGRDYTFVDDIVSGTVAAIERPAAGFRIYNLGGSSPVSLGALVDAIGRSLGMRPRIERRPARAGDVPVTFADIRRAQRELGYQPRVGLAEGLGRFVEWYRGQASAGPLRGADPGGPCGPEEEANVASPVGAIAGARPGSGAES